MGAYKLIALDMDGTVLNEEQQISAENRKAISAALEAGITVIFSTGRGVQSALPYAEEIQLQTPMVTVNGGEVWKAPHVLLKRQLMDLQLIYKLRELALQYDSWYWAYSVQGIFNKDKWTDNPDDLQWLKFGYYNENDEIREKILQTVHSWDGLEITNSHPCNIELNPKGVNKASGVQDVCELLGIEMSQVVAMGDSLNDVPMLRAAGLGIAMGNAQEHVKQIADAVTVSNNEHGVAKAIYEFVLA